MFARSGVPVSPGRVIKLVRTYVRRVQGNGLALGDYLDTQIVMPELQRRAGADEMRRVTAHRDPTGEQAVNRVLRGGAK